MASSGEDALKPAASGLILGRAEFIDDIREKYPDGKRKGRDLPALKELIKISLEAMIKAVGQEFRDTGTRICPEGRTAKSCCIVSKLMVGSNITLI